MSEKTQTAPPKPTAASPLASEILAGTAAHGLDHYVRALGDERETISSAAARVVEDVLTQKPELGSPHIERLAAQLLATRPRVAQAAAHVLPLLAKVAPAKVARHLPALQAAWPAASEVARDGLLRTFAALCVASVTYQKRLVPIFESALRGGGAKELQRWSELVLPALKGEPYAQVRGIVEARLSEPELPRPIAQRLARTLGVKLRAAPR